MEERKKIRERLNYESIILRLLLTGKATEAEKVRSIYRKNNNLNGTEN